MTWRILFFETARGEKPVQEFIKSMDRKTQSKIANMFDLLDSYGNQLRMPYSKKLENELFELRIRGKQEIRVIYAFSKRNIHILHIFKKKTEKTPRKEMKVAQKRLDEIYHI